MRRLLWHRNFVDVCNYITGLLLKVLTTDGAAIQKSPWLMSPIKAVCWGPGIWPHPAHCRLFSLCTVDVDRSITSRLFLCPPGSAYTSKVQRCTVTSNCTSSLEDNELLGGILAEQLTNEDSSQLSCGSADAPFCADTSTLVVCAPNKVFVGVVQCSSQKTAGLQCDERQNICTTLQTSSSHTFLLPSENNVTTLQISVPKTSKEGDYNDGVYDGDDDYDVYEDLDSSQVGWTNVNCTRSGIQCADQSTIMACSESTGEPLVMISCSSLIHSDESENAAGHCDNETSSCVLSSHDSNLALKMEPIDMNHNIVKTCQNYSGLLCADNETLVACSGQPDITNYAIKCTGTGSGLHGHCYKNSCMLVMVDLEAQESDIVITNTTAYTDVVIQKVEVFEVYDDQHEDLPCAPNSTADETIYFTTTTEDSEADDLTAAEENWFNIENPLVPLTDNDTSDNTVLDNIYSVNDTQAATSVSEALSIGTNSSVSEITSADTSLATELISKEVISNVPETISTGASGSVLTEDILTTRKLTSIEYSTAFPETDGTQINSTIAETTFSKGITLDSKFPSTEISSLTTQRAPTEDVTLVTKSFFANDTSTTALTTSIEDVPLASKSDPIEVTFRTTSTADAILASNSNYSETTSVISEATSKEDAILSTKSFPTEESSTAITRDKTIVASKSASLETTSRKDTVLTSNSVSAINSTSDEFPFKDDTIITSNNVSSTEDVSLVSVFTEAALAVPETITKGDTILASKSIPTMTTSEVSENPSIENVTFSSKGTFTEVISITTETTSTENMIVEFKENTSSNLMTSKSIFIENVVPVPENVPAVTSHPILTRIDVHKEDSTGSSIELQNILQVPAIDSTSDTASSPGTQLEIQVDEVLPPKGAENLPVDVLLTTDSDWGIQKCFKPGIQCIDSLTLGACSTDLTLSYTVACSTLLPHISSDHHVVYCNHKLDTCALAVVDVTAK